MAPGYDGSIKIDTSISAKGLNAGVKSITAVLSKLGILIGAVFGIRAIVDFGKAAVDEASRLASAMVGLQSIVEGQGRSFADAQSFIQDYISDGLVPANDAITAFKNLAARGYDDSQIRQTLIALKDAAAFGRNASLTMGQAISSATEGLKNENSILVDNAGVTKNVSVMWKEYAESIGTTVAALTKEQKIQAEVAGIMEETKFQTGDAAKVMQTFSGISLQLGMSITNLKVAFGNILMPILMQVIPLLTAGINQLVIFANAAGQVVGALFGIEPGQFASSMDATADSSQAAADAQGELADETLKAQKAARGALAAFDELNVLQQEEAEPTPAAALGVTLPDTGVLETEADNRLTDLADRLKARIGELLAPYAEPLGRLKDSLTELGGTVWEGLQWGFENILLPLGEWEISEAGPALVDMFAAGLGLLNTTLIALKPFGIWLWDNFLKPLGEWTGAKFIDYLGWLTDGFERIGKVLEEKGFAAALVESWKITGEGIQKAANSAWTWTKDIWSDAGVWFKDNVTTPVSDWFKEAWVDVQEFGSDAWQWIQDEWNDAGEWIKTNVTTPVSDWFKQGWQDVQDAASGAWTWLQDKWTGAGEWFRTKVTEPVKGFFVDSLTDIQTQWEGAKTWFHDNVTEPIKTTFETALAWIGGVWNSAFTGLSDLAKNSTNTVIDFVNNMINAIVAGINTMIGAMNSISVNIPDWVPGFGGQNWGLDIGYVTAPQIPRLATGAVIPAHANMLAMIGEGNKTEIVSPVDLMASTFEEILNRALDSRPVVIQFKGSLAELARILKPEIDNETNRIGGSLVEGSVTT